MHWRDYSDTYCSASIYARDIHHSTRDTDPEMEKPHPKELIHDGTALPSYTDEPYVPEGTVEGQKQLDFWTRMCCTFESFKRRTLADKHNQLNQTLKSRHLHMIAIGGSIGAGLFVGSGSALSRGGPGALLIDFMIIRVVWYRFRVLIQVIQTNDQLTAP